MSNMELWSAKCFALLLMLFASNCRSEEGGSSVVQLDMNNLDTVLGSNELVFVNFYADWCRFSQMLKPVFEQTAIKVQEQYPEPGKVLLAKVDCDSQPTVASKFSVSKYPTLKLFRNGQMTKREYRGQRTPDAFMTFINENMKDSITELDTIEKMENLERKKRTIVGYFESKDSTEYRTFESIGKLLKDDCLFHAAFGEVSRRERATGDNIIFRPPGTDPEMVYLGSLNNMNLLKDWSTDKCVPLVREITFENGEELTEEGLPFLILFHKGEDTESLELYKKEISRSLINEKSKITFLHADCDKFSHPLHHLGKSPKDCPLIAIDSFKHMYLFPDFSQMSVPGKLKQYVSDLHSGKLHREFHHGPDSTPAPKVEDIISQIPDAAILDLVQSQHYKNLPEEIQVEVLARAANLKDNKVRKDNIAVEGITDEGVNDNTMTATTIESIFKKLKPSEYRYTLLNKEEL